MGCSISVMNTMIRLMNIVVRIMKTKFNRPFWVIAIAAFLLADAVERSLNMIVTIV